MALRLVRQTSIEPNITNKDDTVMIRYAYGGYNGVVKDFGLQCGYTAESGMFKVLDGRIVLDGWEIDVDGAGWILNLTGISGTQYHSVYAELNVATESIELKSIYNTGSYPAIEKGSDLTESLNGTSRLLLYNVKAENGVITEVISRFEIIPRLNQKIADMESRLDKLGFKQGEFLYYGTSPEKVNIYKEGNLVCGEITYNYQGGFPSFFLSAYNTEEMNLGRITTTAILPKSVKVAYCETRIGKVYLKRTTTETNIDIQLHPTALVDVDGEINVKVDSFIDNFYDNLNGIDLEIIKVGFWYRLDDKE